MDIKQKLALRKLIRKLESIRGRHTELVSVYIPAGYDIIKIIQHLQQEQGTASNIKDAKTRNNVIDSLERMIRHLRLYKQTPPHGLAVFSGNVSDHPSKITIEVWSIEPPEPLNFRLYRCDQTFMLDPLKEMMEHKETYGLIVLDRRDASIGLLKGNAIKEIASTASNVPGKAKTGGQCIAYGTLVNTPTGLKKIEEIQLGDLLRSYNLKNLELENSQCTDKWFVNKDGILKIKTEKGEIQASKDHTFFVKDMKTKAAEELTEKDVLIDSNKNPVTIEFIEILKGNHKLVDISVKHENFIANGVIVHNSARRYERIRLEMKKEFFKRVGELANQTFLTMKDLKGILVGGPVPTKDEFVDGDYLNNELKKKIIAMQDLGYTGDFGLKELVDKSKEVLAKEEVIKEKKVVNEFFELLRKEPGKVAYGKKEVMEALEIGAVEKLLISENLSEEELEQLQEKGEKSGAQVHIISIETMEGGQIKDLGGYAAILRYALK